ncbi:MAG: glycosyltransferase family 4 protein [Deferrisomatales bacterium]
MLYLTALLLALFLTMPLIPLLRSAAARLGAVDVPCDRKEHCRPMARTGGLAIAVGACLPALIWAPPSSFLGGVLGGAAIVLLFGFLDDVKNLGHRVKFAGQITAALVVVLYGGVRIESLGAFLPDAAVLPALVAVPLTVVVIVGVTNAINLADGLDGLAGGIVALSLGCVAYLAYQAGDPVVALLAAGTVGAILGFLRFNTYPANIFMGDAGSQFLGFVAVTLSLHLTQGAPSLSPILPLLLLGLPVLDTLTVMAGRVRSGRSPFRAGRDHLHHRLRSLGFSHRETVVAAYVFQSALITAAYFFQSASDLVLAAGYATGCGALLYLLRRAEGTGWSMERSTTAYRALKTALDRIRDRGLLVKGAFRAVELGLPAFFLVSWFMPSTIPREYGYFAAGLMVLVLLGGLTRPSWGRWSLRLAVYLTIPAVIYLCETQAGEWVSADAWRVYNLALALLVALMIVVVKFSRRDAFRSSPMDFLVLFLAVVVPNFFGGPHWMGVVATKIVALFFGYEVLLAELRGQLGWVGATTLTFLGVAVVRGLWM